MPSLLKNSTTAIKSQVPARWWFVLIIIAFRDQNMGSTLQIKVLAVHTLLFNS